MSNSNVYLFYNIICVDSYCITIKRMTLSLLRHRAMEEGYSIAVTMATIICDNAMYFSGKSVTFFL